MRSWRARFGDRSSLALGLCPICLGADRSGLTAGLPAAALVLLTVAFVAMAAVARVVWRIWRYEAR